MNWHRSRNAWLRLHACSAATYSSNRGPDGRGPIASRTYASCWERAASVSRHDRLVAEGVVRVMGWGEGWWIVGVIVMVACMYWMARMMMGHGSGRGHVEGEARSPSADDILAERFARGEISQEEFEQRRRVLEGHPK